MLYEINEEIRKLFEALDGDENGEIEDFDGTVAKIEALQATKQEILTWVAKEVFNTRAEADKVKAEIDRLDTNKKRLEQKEERLMNVLDRECAGQKTDLGICVASYRKSTSIKIFDEEATMKYLQANRLVDCIKVPPLEIRANEVKKLLKEGLLIDGCELEEHRTLGLR